MMPELPLDKVKARFVNVTKRYGTLTTVNDVTLDIRDGEFLTFLGPSGSGKTTLLQILAGLTDATGGQVLIDGRDVTHVPPFRRDIGVVFQSYALFPHMSVLDNVAFPLKMRNVASAERLRRAMSALEMVKLDHVAARPPRALSGGQQQRVALARALVFEPSILLMDEPLGALDRNLRQHMQAEILQLHRRLGVTTVYVTHDQEEALSMSDRIAVVRNGEIAQIDTVRAIYDTPKDMFIANFLGESNRFTGRVVAGIDGLMLSVPGMNGPLPLPFHLPSWLAEGTMADFALRPERIRVVAADGVSEPCEVALPATVMGEMYLGAQNVLTLALAEGGRITVRIPNYTRSTPFGEGARVNLVWHRDSAVVMPASAETA